MATNINKKGYKMSDKSITPANIKNLSFKKQFGNYEENLEEQATLKKEVLKLEKELKVLTAPYTQSGSIYVPEAETIKSGAGPYVPMGIRFDDITPSMLRIFKPFKRIPEFDKYRDFKSAFASLKNSEIKHFLDQKYKGVAKYIDEVSDYLNEIFVREEDKEKSKELQEKFSSLLEQYNEKSSRLEEVTTLLNNLERYVDMAHKVSKINGVNKK